MKKILFTLLFLASFSAFSQGGIWWRTNKAYGEQKYRSAFDSTLFFPTGNGTPKLNSINLGQSAFYYDSAAKKLYVFSPSDSTWDDYTPGGSVDLQGATDNGNETTNSIVVNGETKGIYVASIADPLKYSGAFTRSGQPVLYVGTGSPGSAVFIPPVSGFTQDNEITLPDSSGKLVLRINNISPDSKGNVTISTGGVSPSDTAAMLAAYLRKVNFADSIHSYFGGTHLASDFTTSSTTAVSTSLSFTAAANSVYRVTISGTASKATSSTGLKLAIDAPAGSTIKGVQYGGQASLSTALQNSLISTISTLGGTFATGTGVEVPFRMEFILETSSTAGAVTLQGATVTSNTATIYARTSMFWTKSVAQ